MWREAERLGDTSGVFGDPEAGSGRVAIDFKLLVSSFRVLF